MNREKMIEMERASTFEFKMPGTRVTCACGADCRVNDEGVMAGHKSARDGRTCSNGYTTLWQTNGSVNRDDSTTAQRIAWIASQRGR